MSTPNAPTPEHDADQHQQMDELIERADLNRADRLRRQAERDASWRQHMKAATHSSLCIGVMAEHLAQRLPEDGEDGGRLHAAAAWIAEEAKHMDALLLAMLQEETADD